MFGIADDLVPVSGSTFSPFQQAIKVSFKTTEMRGEFTLFKTLPIKSVLNQKDRASPLFLGNSLSVVFHLLVDQGQDLYKERRMGKHEDRVLKLFGFAYSSHGGSITSRLADRKSFILPHGGRFEHFLDSNLFTNPKRVC